MTFINILEVLGTLIVALGGFEGIKFLLNKRAEKKKAQAEADKADHEAQDAKYSGVNDEYQRIIESLHTEIDELKEQLSFAQEHMKGKSEMIEKLQHKMMEQVQESQEQIVIKQAKIEELMQDINNLTSSNTALSMVRCEKLKCVDREPPFGYGGIDIKNGMLVKEE